MQEQKAYTVKKKREIKCQQLQQNNEITGTT